MIKRVTWLLVLLSCTVSVAELAQAQATESEVFALQEEVHAGDQAAMRSLLSLKADGAVAEYVSVIMGGAIRKHPGAFLAEVARTSRAQCDPCLDSMLGNLGDNFVDKLPEQVAELSRRRQALRSVKTPALVPLRDKCVLLLSRQINRIQSLIKQGIAVQP